MNKIIDPIEQAMAEVMDLSSPPRTNRIPLYLRQPVPLYWNDFAPRGDHTLSHGEWVRRQFENMWKQGSICRCGTCGWMDRERKLKVWFINTGLRGVEYCPRCSSRYIEFYDGLSPNQELLLLP